MIGRSLTGLVLLSIPLLATNVSLARTWRDTTGGFSVEGEYISVAKGVVALRRMDNKKMIKVPFARLSKDDQLYVRKRWEESQPAELDSPLGKVVNAEYPKSVNRSAQYYGVDITRVNFNLGFGGGSAGVRASSPPTEVLLRTQVLSPQADTRPVWIVFDGRKSGQRLEVPLSKYTIIIDNKSYPCMGANAGKKPGDCVGSDITIGDMAKKGVTGKDVNERLQNLIDEHRKASTVKYDNSPRYRKLLFVLPRNAKQITLKYEPPSGKAQQIMLTLSG